MSFIKNSLHQIRRKESQLIEFNSTAWGQFGPVVKVVNVRSTNAGSTGSIPGVDKTDIFVPLHNIGM